MQNGTLCSVKRVLGRGLVFQSHSTPISFVKSNQGHSFAFLNGLVWYTGYPGFSFLVRKTEAYMFLWFLQSSGTHTLRFSEPYSLVPQCTKVVIGSENRSIPCWLPQATAVLFHLPRDQRCLAITSQIASIHSGQAPAVENSGKFRKIPENSGK